MTAVLLVFGVVGFASADNTTQVTVSISYPCGDYGPANQECDTDVAFSRDIGVGGDVVNIYITLLDANSNPATAGPAGEPLATLPIQILTSLGRALPPSLTPNTFVSDSATGRPTANAARANVDYTGAIPGTDIITVIVAADPDPIVATASVNVSAPAAEGLVVRTYRGVDPPSLIYTDMFVEPYWQSDNFGANELAGASVDFTVVAVEAGGLYTYAPELEGQQVTVTAYADYSANGDDIGTAPQEMVPVATATATFVNGIAEGTITIGKAGPAGLDVVLTAATEDSLETTQPPVDDTSGGLNDGVQDDVDYVTMQSPSIPTGIIIGNDLFGNGNYLVEADCLPVPDDGTWGPTLTIAPAILVDDRMNAVVSSGGRNVIASLDPALDLLLTDNAGVGDPLAASDAWDIVAGEYISTSGNAGLQVIPGPDNDHPLVSGGLTVTAGLLTDQASVELLTSDLAGGIAFLVTNDTGVDIDAGDEVTLTLSSIVVSGDSIEITAAAAPGAQLLSLADQEFQDAATTLDIASVSDADDTTPGIQVRIRIYGPALTPGIDPVTITVTVTSKCNIAADTIVNDVDTLEPVLLNVVAVDGDPDNAVDLSANPVVVTKRFIADNTAQDLILEDDLQTLDEFGNVVDPSPAITATSQQGTPNVYGIGDDELELTYPNAAAGSTDTVGVTTVTGLLTRDFEIGDIISEAPAAVEPTAILVRQEGPQSVGGALIPPGAGGEVIIRISGNATGTSDVSAQINLTGEEGQPLPELRFPNGNAFPAPAQTDDFTLDLTTPADTRYVVSGVGLVEISVIDRDTTDPLAEGTLLIGFGTVISACEVAISPPEALILPGAELTFAATTEGVGCNAPNYTWEISEAGCTGSSISATGTYTAGAEDNTCSDTIMVTDAANGSEQATATVAVTDTLPVVEIDGPLTIGPIPEGCTSATYTAETTLAGDPISGTYTWELDGVSSGTGNTSNTFEVTCTEDGPHTLMVTDTQNGNITNSVTIVCDCTVGIDASIEAEFTGCGSPFTIWFGVVSIEGTDTAFGPTAAVSYDSPLVVGLPRLLNRQAQTITQLVLTLPSILYPGIVGPAQDYPATVEVTVKDLFPLGGEGLSDTIVIPACGTVNP
jgi:hypothetical protein